MQAQVSCSRLIYCWCECGAWMVVDLYRWCCDWSENCPMWHHSGLMAAGIGSAFPVFLMFLTERDEWVSELITEWINQWMVVTVSFDKVPRPSVKPNQSPWAHTLCSVHVHVLCLLQHSPLFKAFLAAFHMISLFPLSFFLEAHISCCQQTDTLQVCTFPGSYMEKKQTLVVSCNKLTTIRIFSGGRTLKKKN